MSADKTAEAIRLVGIGASAGGLDALEAFFDGVPPESGLSFVVVQHLSPDFESMMDQLLARHTAMEVRQIEDGDRVLRDHVYLIPPKTGVVVSQGRLRLTEKQPHAGLNLPIDAFFESMGREFGARAAAVVLSGTGADGSQGIQEVSARGGLVMVQDPGSAQFDGMPKSAIQTGCVDRVLPPDAMGGALGQFAGATRAERPDAHPPHPDTRYAALFTLLDERFGVDFRQYKTKTVTRRIERRVQLRQIESIDQYLESLSDDPQELSALYQDLLIGVTQFFRDPDAFNVLNDLAIARIFADREPHSELRVWAAACGTGEEAYSLAMLLHEQAERRAWRGEIKVFATDVHRGSIKQAGAGVYTADQVAPVGADRIAKYFHRAGDSYRVIDTLRRMVVFAPHNLLADAPFTNLDLVSCRNVLIYLFPEAQRRVLAMFRLALRQGGYLFLGSSETTGPAADAFEPVNAKTNLFRKHRDTRPATLFEVKASATLAAGDPQRPATGPRRLAEQQVVAAYEGLAADYVPPTFVVDTAGELIYSTTGASRFLHRQEGFASSALVELVDSGLRTAIAGILNRRTRSQQTIRHRGVTTADGEATVDIVARPIRLPGADEAVLAISLVAPTPAAQSQRADAAGPASPPGVAADRIASLENELAYSQENLQATIEQLQTSNEQLRTSNEELVAANEELQSTNEELHSVNEELHTVTTEHQRKIQELTVLTEDMENLFQSTDIATLFLDDELRIRRYSPGIESVFQLQAGDLGRKIGAFANSLDYPELSDDLQQVVTERTRVEKEVRGPNGSPYLIQISPYRSAVGSNGIVLALVDLSLLEETRRELKRNESLFRSTFENAAVGIARVAPEGRWLDVNQRLCDILGYTREELLSVTFQDVTDPEYLNADLRDLERLLAGKIDRYAMQKRFVARSGRRIWVNITMSVQRDAQGNPDYCIKIVEDISKRKRFEARLQDAIKQRERFLATMSHELRNPLAALMHAARLLERPEASADHPRALEVVMRQSTQISNLLDDLLDVSRVTQDKIRLNRRVIDLRPLIDDAVELVLPGAENHDFELHVVKPDTPVLIDADSTRVLQIIHNLLSNAVKYTPPGEAITVQADAQDGMAVVRVADTGQGIDPDLIDHIFDMFVQAEDEISERESGMGLGLTLVRSLTELHGGSVSGHSDGPGQGSTFTVRLPLAEQKVESARRAGQPAATLKKLRRVVLVEDEDDAREMLAETLRLDGYEVVTAPDGDQGLAAILHETPDVALVDVSLPGLNGYDIARQVRKTLDGAEVRLIAMTGFGRDIDRARSRSAGFDLHLVKPVRPDDLAQALSAPLVE